MTTADQFGQTGYIYRGIVPSSSNDPAAVLPANYTFTATVNRGANTFNVVLPK